LEIVTPDGVPQSIKNQATFVTYMLPTLYPQSGKITFLPKCLLDALAQRHTLSFHIDYGWMAGKCKPDLKSIPFSTDLRKWRLLQTTGETHFVRNLTSWESPKMRQLVS